MEDINTDSESEIKTPGTSINGSTSIEELELSDLLQTEEELSQEDKDMDTDKIWLPSLESTEIMPIKRLFSGEVLTETLETTENNALMFMEDQTLTIDTLPGIDALTVDIKLGG